MLLEQLLLEDRADFIAQQMGPKLVARLQQDTRQQAEPRAILDQLLAADPTKNQQYIQWIAKQYVAGGFKMEDLSRIKGELVNFDRVKPKLANKDLNSYKTLPELYSALEPFANTEVVTNKEEERRLSEEMYKQATVLYKGADYTLLSPKTEAASCFFGRGTKWCTAATDNNMFETYNDISPLYIIMDSSGDKYQLHFPVPRDPYEIEDEDNGEPPVEHMPPSSMDAQDVEVELKVLLGKYPALESLLMAQTNLHLWTDPTNPESLKWYTQNVGKKVAATPEQLASVKARKKAFAANNSRLRREYEEVQKRRAQEVPTNERDLNNQWSGMGHKVWPEAEPTIATFPKLACSYALYAKRGRFPEGEKAISSDASSAYSYATSIIKGRWPEGEAAIATDDYWKGYYEREFKVTL